MFPTRHAVQRYQQRVAATSTGEAFRTLQSAAQRARRRSTPRWWTPVAAAPGLLFLFPASPPGVCLLCRDGVILTVFQCEVCRRWVADEPPPASHRRSLPYRRPVSGALLREAA